MVVGQPELRLRYAVLCDEVDITNAITASTEAVGATPSSHPVLGGRL